jgi:ankyrin repeat protein
MLKIKKLFFIVQYFFYKNPLKTAIIKNNNIILPYLLTSHNYDLNKLDENYSTALDYALRLRNIEIMQILIGNNAKLGKGFYEISDEDELLELFVALYKARYDFNNYDMLGFTAMHYAKILRAEQAIKILLSCGISLNNKSIAFDASRFLNNSPNDGSYFYH